MFGIGTGELLLLLLIALIVLGPERMPKAARDIGRVIGELRKTSDELREEFLNADKLLDRAANASETPTQAIPQTSATADAPAAPDNPGETAFDREMREARERLKAQRES